MVGNEEHVLIREDMLYDQINASSIWAKVDDRCNHVSSAEP